MEVGQNEAHWGRVHVDRSRTLTNGGFRVWSPGEWNHYCHQLCRVFSSVHGRYRQCNVSPQQNSNVDLCMQGKQAWQTLANTTKQFPWHFWRNPRRYVHGLACSRPWSRFWRRNSNVDFDRSSVLCLPPPSPSPLPSPLLPHLLLLGNPPEIQDFSLL